MQLAPGWQPWVLLPALAALILVPLWWPAAALLGGWAVFAFVFFRDPGRTVGEGIVAAADGRITEIDGRAVTFLNLHHVHVVRTPYEGTVKTVERVSGSRLPAFLKGAEKNGGVSITISTEWGRRRVDLKAGFIARRAVSFVDEGEQLDKGQRIGMIRFGSRVDVDLPEGAVPELAVGEMARAGRTTLARPPGEGKEASR